MKLFNFDKSARMSIPKGREVHGVKIEKVPVGRYISALKEMEDLPQTILDDCFPGQDLDDILMLLTTGDRSAILAALTRLLTVVPEHVLTACGYILDQSPEFLMNNLTPKELLDVLQAFWKVNDMSDFFKAVWRPIQKRLATRSIGSSDGSPSPRA